MRHMSVAINNQHASASPLHDIVNDPASDPASDAMRLLNRLGIGPHTFQTLPESATCRGRAQIRHGDLDQLAHKLEADNKKGKAITVMVNAGDGKGRRAGNVTAVRALFVDLDGAPLSRVLTAALPPHMVIETSPGKYHAYWCVDGISLNEFTALQRQLAARFGGDPAVSDLSRCMRVPGFLHQKREPFRSRLVRCDEAAQRYTRAQLIQAFDLKFPEAAQAKPSTTGFAANEPSVVPFVPLATDGSIAAGNRNRTLFALACGWRDDGFTPVEAESRLLKTNATRCMSPLSAREVRGIVTSAFEQPPRPGFAKIPYAVLDSPAYKALPTSAVKLLLVAVRRFNGRNNGNISLPDEGLKSEGKGLADPKAVREARRALLKAAFLRVARPASWRDGGKAKRCYLYEITFLKNRPEQAGW
jgi:hypothetical protein